MEPGSFLAGSETRLGTKVLVEDHSKPRFHPSRGPRRIPSGEVRSVLRNIETSLRRSSAFEFVAPSDFGMGPILRVHDSGYIAFLQSIWTKWRDAGNEGDVMPYLWPVPGLRRVPHENLNALVGSYAFSSDTPIMSGTWRAAYQGAQSALSALQQVRDGERAAFALTRPPGHHPHAAFFGGYCFLNNVAITAQAAIDLGHRWRRGRQSEQAAARRHYIRDLVRCTEASPERHRPRRIGACHRGLERGHVRGRPDFKIPPEGGR